MGLGASRVRVRSTPVSSMPSDDPEARIHDTGSFGEGDRGLAGYEDSGQAEIITMPPDTFGSSQPGSNPGETGPGIGRRASTSITSLPTS